MEQPGWTTGPDRTGPWVYVAAALIMPGAAAWTRHDWRGQRHLPRRGGVIVAVNHVGYADPFVVARYVFAAGRVPRFLVKAEAFDLRPWGRILSGADQIPVRRGGPDAAVALEDAVEALGRGAAVVVYPEGTVTKDPDVWPMLAKTGVGRLALLSGAPVVPVAQWGAHRLLDAERRPRLTTRPLVQIAAGTPVDLSRWAGFSGTEAAREVTDAVMGRVRSLLAVLREQAPPKDVWDPREGRRVPVPERATAEGCEIS